MLATEIIEVSALQFPLIPLEPITKIGLFSTVDERFNAFDEANPHVYQALRIMALDAKGKGKQVPIELLINVLRYVYEVGPMNEGLSINNNFKALYARKLNRTVELRGYFKTRRRRFQGEYIE